MHFVSVDVTNNTGPTYLKSSFKVFWVMTLCSVILKMEAACSCKTAKHQYSLQQFCFSQKHL